MASVEFVSIPRRLIGAVSPAALAVYAEIAAYCRPPGDGQPTLGALAVAVGSDRNAVHRAIGELRAAGAVEVRERYGPGGARLANRYLLPDWRRDPATR